MKAGIYLGKKSVGVKDLPFPDIDDNDVLVENICSCISRSDIAAYKKGPETTSPIIPGQEFGHATISRITDFGMNIMDFNWGERIYPYPCNVKKDPGRANAIGAFSEFMLAEDAALNHSLFRIPDDISDRLACMIEPFMIGCRAARRGMRLRDAYEVAEALQEQSTMVGDPRYHSGESALVFGCDTVGIAAAVALQWFGMGRVMICDSSDLRLDIAKGLGFEICNPEKEDLIRKSCEFFGSAASASNFPAIHCWIDTTGEGKNLDQYMTWGMAESRFVSLSGDVGTYPLNLPELIRAQKTITGADGYTTDDLQDVIGIMRSGYWNLESMITHEFFIDRLEDAFAVAADDEISCSVIVHF